jgi:predicted phage replisome organizer
MASKNKTKIYFWLKLDNNFYKNLAIKKARRLAGGDTMVIIYQKLMLESLQNNGVLYFEGVLENIVEELSLQLDEDIENVAMTLDLFTKSGLIQLNDSNDIEMLQVPALIDQETNWSKYKRDTRNKEGIKKLDIVQPLSNHCPTEIELELEKELDIELDIESESDIENDADSDYKKITDFYQSNFGVITQLISQDISFNLKDYGYDLVHESMKRAIFRQKQYAYSVQILKSWSKNNIKTLEDVEADDNKFSRGKTTNTDDKSDWTWAEKKAGFREV